MEESGTQKQAVATSSRPKKRGRKQKQKSLNRLLSETRNQSDIKSLNDELKKGKEECKSENKLLSEGADKLESEVSDESKKVKILKMVIEEQETVAQQLEQHILNTDCQEHDEENSESSLPIDYEYLNKLDCKLPDYLSSLLEEYGGGSVNITDFTVSKENSREIKKIYSQHPDTASGVKVDLPSLRNFYESVLAEVHKIATNKETKAEVTPREIELMEKGTKDLEFAGFEISWLRDLVVKRLKGKKKL